MNRRFASSRIRRWSDFNKQYSVAISCLFFPCFHLFSGCNSFIFAKPVFAYTNFLVISPLFLRHYSMRKKTLNFFKKIACIENAFLVSYWPVAPLKAKPRAEATIDLWELNGAKERDPAIPLNGGNLRKGRGTQWTDMLVVMPETPWGVSTIWTNSFSESLILAQNERW